ncbi:site-specific DNA-methyltransferase [Planctomycetota bacterium]|nr:site-specific DNA-methyltransferase [Planctomycetota bacterium]
MTALDTPAAPTVSDIKFNALKSKFRELFELDKSDLDFGIYRIMAAKNDEVTEFLDKQLKDVVQQILADHGADAADKLQAQIDEARKAASAAGFNPDESPKVIELEALKSSAGGKGAAELEADIYNHLFSFFSRYYDEGDFISKRRYKGDTYAIPYSGEEVTLHWANKDQYYIKSGEWHKDYCFKVAGNKTVHFKLVDATQETNNNKESDNEKRRYILDTTNPVEVVGNKLILHFQFRAPTEDEKKTVKESEATRTFGGDFDKNKSKANPAQKKAGDEREQFCADAEKRAFQAMPADWVKLLAKVDDSSKTDSKPERTLLGKQLDHYTAKNSFDYFIHKDLSGFLTRELDFYIKSEVVRLDDLEHLEPTHLQRVQGKVKAIRNVAARIIEFLGSLENFQKKLWLKKKFVLNTNWLVTIDRLSDELRTEVADNKDQWQAWEDLGFKPQEVKQDVGLYQDAAWGSREYIDANDKLVVDTRFFDGLFKTKLLASEEVLAGNVTLDDATSGVLINSENFQALNLLQDRYKEQVKCVYIDPPYNTDASAIIYKNEYKNSSWISLIEDRLFLAQPLLEDSGILSFAIDDEEVAEARALLKTIFAKEIGIAVVRSNPQSRKTKGKFSPVHEYALFYGNSSGAIPGSLDVSEKKAARYPHTDENGRYAWMNFIRTGNNDKRSDRPKLFYPIWVDQNDKIRIPQMHWDLQRNEYVIDEKTREFEEIVYPISDNNGNLIEKNWHRGHIRVESDPSEYRVRRNANGKISIDFKTRMDAAAMPTTWWDNNDYASANYGASELKDLFGEKPFDFPKAQKLVQDCIQASLKSSGPACLMDFFAGSATTGHAAINLNRDRNNEDIKFVLVEMGTYFSSVVKPRITKVLYSTEWKNGKAVKHGEGTSALVKYFSLESYDDAMTNLPTPTDGIFNQADTKTKEALITYALDIELGPHMLNLKAFENPWDYKIKAQLAGSDEIKEESVDLIETFNYLLGLKVHAYGPIESYAAEFEKTDHPDDKGKLKVAKRLKKAQDGPYIFQRIEGELLDGTKVLVVWRKLTGDAEKDAAVLDQWMDKHSEKTSDRSPYREFKYTYLNGPVTLPQPTQDIRSVYPIEETFKDRMFAGTEGQNG